MSERCKTWAEWDALMQKESARFGKALRTIQEREQQVRQKHERIVYDDLMSLKPEHSREQEKEEASTAQWKAMFPYRNKAEEHARSYDYEGPYKVMVSFNPALVPWGTSWCVPETGKVYHIEGNEWVEMPDSSN